MTDSTASTISPGLTESQSHSVPQLNNLNKPSGRNSIHINDLPFDIFILIWNLVRATEDNERPYFPVIVSHVCRTWRHYAFEASSFWSTVDFRARRVNMGRAQFWLERSKDSPVNINIGSEPFQGASVSKAKVIMRMIMPHLGHCRSLKVQGVPEKVARVIFDRLRDTSAPVLEVLELSTADGTKWEPKPFREGKAPLLLDISIEGRFQKYFLERFTNLRRLRITDPRLSSINYGENVAYVHKTLSMLPQLEILLIDDGQAHITGYNPEFLLSTNLHPPLTHDSLMQLSLHVPYPNGDAILTSLNLPHVRYFPNHRKPLNEFSFGLWNLQYMKRTHPFPRLLSLCLQGRRNAENLPYLEGALEGAPLLESLSFVYVHFGGDESISCLSRVCPRLEWLTLHRCAGCTLKGVMSIVEGRRTRKGFEPLLHLTVREWPWEAGLVKDSDKETWESLGRRLEAKLLIPTDYENLYLSRFDVK